MELKSIIPLTGPNQINTVWNIRMILMIHGKFLSTPCLNTNLIPVIILAFAVIKVVQGMSDAKNKMPAEDELSKIIMLRTGSTSFQLSLFLWLIIGSVEDRIELEGHTIIGAGILGMAILFALSWIYHRFIRRSHD